MAKGVRDNHPNRYKKCSREEKKKRIEQAANWLLENPHARAKDFNDWASAAWGIERCTCVTYKREAFKLLNKKEDINIEAKLRLSLNSLNKQYIRAWEAGSYDLAFKIQTEINKLNGLHVNRTQIDVTGEVPLFSAESIDASEVEKPKKDDTRGTKK